jgi:hypothetical protein
MSMTVSFFFSVQSEKNQQLTGYLIYLIPVFIPIIVRLNDSMGDVGRGRLEVLHAVERTWQPACVTHWDNGSSENDICSQMGYT